MTHELPSQLFRSTFKAIDRDVLRWFPGHMGKGLKQMQQKLRSVDCIVEVHDARIPLSGKNSEFKFKISGVKPHILVLNKFDLISSKYIPKIKERLKDDYKNVIFTNCKNQRCKGIGELFPLAQTLIHNSNRYNRTAEEDYNIMIIGVPNVGKSSLVNALRVKYLHRGNASPVGAAPGITRSVLHKIKISEKPLFFMLDTPGILTPYVPTTEVGLKLALCATIQDHLVGENVIADYLLFTLNKFEHFRYVKHFNLEKPTDSILEVLTKICKDNNRMLKIKDANNAYMLRPDFDYAAQLMIRSFRRGELGNILLDRDLL